MPGDNNLTTQLSDLEKTMRIITEHIRQTHGDVVKLEKDYYWDIADSQLYDPAKDPSGLEVGQLSHDLERLQKILNGDDPIGYALVWLAAVLRYIGQQNVV